MSMMAGLPVCGALAYAERALAGELKSLKPDLEACVAALDDTAHRRAQRWFGESGADQQDVLLAALEAGELEGCRDREVFETIRELALEGTFGDPYHGGNANLAGWRLLGFPGPQMVATCDDQRLDVVPTAELPLGLRARAVGGFRREP